MRCVTAGMVSYGAVLLDKVRFVGALYGEVRQARYGVLRSDMVWAVRLDVAGLYC